MTYRTDADNLTDIQGNQTLEQVDHATRHNEANASAKSLADGLDALDAAKVGNAGGVPSIQAGTRASQPAAATAGRLFLVTDELVIERDNGTGWVQLVDLAHRNDTTNPHATTAAQVGADPVGTAAAALTTHEGAVDPHPAYTTEAEAAAAAPVQSVNAQTGAVALGAGDVGADPAGTAASAVSTHEGAADPHGQYATDAKVDGLGAADVGAEPAIDRTGASAGNVATLQADGSLALDPAASGTNVELPEGASWVLATDDQGVADANPTFLGGPVAWVILEAQQEPAAPDAPTSLLASGGQDGEVPLTWTPSASVQGAAPDGHRVYRNTSDDFGTATQVGADLGAAIGGFTDTTVTNGTTYFYWITAFNTVGESSPSNVSSAAPSAGSAAYFTDFSEYTLDVAPSDWTQRWTGEPTPAVVETFAGATGGVALAMQPASGGFQRTFLSWDALDVEPGRQDFEIYARMNTGGNPDRIMLAGRGSDAGGSEGYLSYLRDSNNAQLARYLNGNFTQVAVSTFSYAADTWYRMVLRVQGSSVQFKVWADGDSEPAGWTVEGTDTSITAAGWIGVGVPSGTSRVQWDVVGVAFGGAAAPRVAP